MVSADEQPPHVFAKMKLSFSDVHAGVKKLRTGEVAWRTFVQPVIFLFISAKRAEVKLLSQAFGKRKMKPMQIAMEEMAAAQVCHLSIRTFFLALRSHIGLEPKQSFTSKRSSTRHPYCTQRDLDNHHAQPRIAETFMDGSCIGKVPTEVFVTVCPSLMFKPQACCRPTISCGFLFLRARSLDPDGVHGPAPGQSPAAVGISGASCVF